MSEPTGAQRTPRTWGETVWPTSKQLADWLKVCTDNERLIHSEIALRDSQAVDRSLVRGGTYDEAVMHARWHRALDEPSLDRGPIGSHIRQALARAWNACATEAFERGLLHDAAAEEMAGRNPYSNEGTRHES